MNEEKIEVTELDKENMEEIIQEELENKLDDLDSKEGFKSELIEEAALNRELEVKRLNYNTVIITINGKELLFRDMNGPLSSAAMEAVCDDKNMSRSLIKSAGLSVPESTYLRLSDKDGIRQFVDKIGYPVVLKPNNLSRGTGVFMNIDSDESLEETLKELSEVLDNEHEKILIEKQYEGDDYRFFVVDGKIISATKREPANVVGDGRKTVGELIEDKNKMRSGNRNLKDNLIPRDETKLKRLFRDGWNFDTIPPEGETMVLRDESNVSGGGDSIDVTDDVHSDFKELAVKAMKSVPGLPYAGVDIIAKDITEVPKDDNYVVTEVEFSPGPVSEYPWAGVRRDMAGPIIEFYMNYLEKLETN